MAADTFDIQKLVYESGIPRRTIYFYVQQGLLPPPQGAGLAAYYSEAHLLRLRLIPILRQQGLRLDEIRERFAQMSVEEMRRLVREAEQAAVRQRSAEQRALKPGFLNGSPSPAPSLPGVQDTAGLDWGWGAGHFTHYSLPAGITLAVPDTLTPANRRCLEQLLQAARLIFYGPGIQFADQEPGESAINPDLPENEETQP
jgi:DNA-binding transcriptional MerR regulator